MDYIFTYPRDQFEEGKLKSSEVKKLIDRHESELVENIQKLINYYMGQQSINSEESSKPQTVCNHAKDISDTASGYFLGSPISWKQIGEPTEEKSEGKEEPENDRLGKAKPEAKTDFDKLMDAFDHAQTADTDQENALYLSICGRAYEYVYAEEDEPELMTLPLDPLHTFIVCDESIEHKELFAVYYYYKKNDVSDKEDTKLYIKVMTDSEILDWVLTSNEDKEPERTSHNMGHIPVILYRNNKFCIGDFEQQIGLIDAYNTLTSDRVEDKEQFIDAILVIYGSLLGENSESSDKAMDEVKKKKLLELDDDARAEYLTRTLDEGGMEVLRTALKEDIYTFSHVPNLTDKNFAGNSSGVAMEYKLLGLEMLTKIKERWYRKSLRKRLKIFLHFYGIKEMKLAEENLEAKFSRGLPKNLAEIASIVNGLTGKVSQATLLSQIPFVEDPMAEIEAVRAENEEKLKQQQEIFAATANTPPESGNTPPESSILSRREPKKDVKDDE